MASKVWVAVLLPLALGALACEPDAGDDPSGEPDTLAIRVPDAPEDLDARVEEGARRVGGAVGEALEETGEVIERAGERLREESTGPDTTGDGL